MSKRIGILTTGGDSPGINAVLRGVGKAAHSQYGMEVTGFQDGFLGLVERKMVDLEGSALSNILTLGGTILGTSRDRPDRMMVGGKLQDMTSAVIEACRSLELEGLVVLGGSDAQESALHLKKSGLNVITLPVTIDNDVACTDTSVGFDTALGVAAEAIDRLHTTASSHHRVIIVEVMGKTTGWLTLGAGTAGGADVILSAARLASASALWRSRKGRSPRIRSSSSSRPKRSMPGCGPGWRENGSPGGWIRLSASRPAATPSTWPASWKH
jgi:6-phosphofructokinase